MSCPNDALLRTHVDEADRGTAAHVDGCDTCAQRVEELTGDARFAARAVADLAAPLSERVDVEAALRAATSPTTAGRSPRTKVSAQRLRLPLSMAAGVVAMAVAALVALTPTGQEAAADFLAGFRAERFEVVTFDPDQPMAGLEGLGDVVEVDQGDDGGREPTEVETLADAAGIAGFEPSVPTSLPDGASLTAMEAAAPKSMRLTLRGDQAPDLPADLDGAQLIVSVPGMVASIYDVDGKMLVVGEAGQLAVDAEGANLADIRAYLLRRPEVPRDLAAQLEAIDDWTTTVPIPIPVDEYVWKDTTVGDAPGLMVSDPAGSGLLWQADGRIHAIGGEGVDVDLLRTIADGLR